MATKALPRRERMNLMDLLDWVLFGALLVYGVLCLFTALRLRRETKLFDSQVLYPGGLRKEDCRDPEGFIAYMRPRMLLLGVVFTLSALVYFIKLRLGLPKIASIAHIVLTAAVLLYGFWMFHDAAKRFW